MSDLDEGRDVRAAFGTLLADEPASPWSASDDVARGRALQRRRRTRAGAGIGLVAAAVLVFGVFGPLRPQPTVVVPPAYQPPAVQGVDAAWLAALDRSFTAFNGPVVDWSRSTVAPTAGGGFSLDLTLVGATVTAGGEDFTIEYPEPPGPPVARAFVTWKPAGGEGPVLASCAAPTCVRSDRGISPGFAEQGGRWDGDGAQLAGTFVVDRTYDDGAALEIASSPHPDAVPAVGAVMNYGGIQYVLDRVGRPSDGSPLPSEDVYGMTALLADLGWTVQNVTVQRVPQGAPTVVSWSAYQTGGDPGGPTGFLTVRAWDESSWKPGADGVLQGSALSGCTGASCAEGSTVPGCIPGGCGAWTQRGVVTTREIDGVPANARILARYDEQAKLAFEIIVDPLQCITCNADPLPPFLRYDETATLADGLQAALSGGPTPQPTPSTSPPVQKDAVTQALEALGHRVISSDQRGGEVGGTTTVYSVDVDLNADNPVNASLTVTRVPAGVEVGSERVALSGVAMNSCDERTCTPVTSVTYPCPSSSCFQDWWAITTPAYTGLDQGTLLVFRSNGSQAVELVVGVPSCATCGTGPTGKAFLSLEDAQQVLNAIGLGDGSATPASAASCTAEQVKLVPAVDTTGGATGERSVAIEVYARNPQISCVLDGVPTVGLQSGASEGSALVYTEGLYQQGPQRSTAVAVDAEHAAVFVVAKARCDTGPVELVDQLTVQLPGDRTVTGASLPPELRLVLCGGAAADTSTVWVSAFTPRAGGVG